VKKKARFKKTKRGNHKGIGLMILFVFTSTLALIK